MSHPSMPFDQRRMSLTSEQWHRRKWKNNTLAQLDRLLSGNHWIDQEARQRVCDTLVSLMEDRIVEIVLAVLEETQR